MTSSNFKILYFENCFTYQYKAIVQNQFISTKVTDVIQYLLFCHFIRNRPWILNFPQPTFIKSAIIYDLHCLGGWNLHKMSVTKFGSVEKKRRSAAFPVLYLFEIVWQGGKFTPPNRNRVNTVNLMISILTILL